MKTFNQTITSLLIKHKIDLLVVSFLSLFLPLFLYNLGSYSLVDFDEAWFAEVALNILKRGNPLVLTFNGLSFNEHPPLGFILMAISFVLFGVNEFAARLPEALSAFFSLLLLYFIGKELFNRAIGLGASLILASTVWFVLRARSGNLDAVFLMFYLLTFYIAIKLKYHPLLLIPLVFSLAAVLLTKMLVGLSILIPITIEWLIEKQVISFKRILLGIFLVTLLILPWIIANTYLYHLNFIKHIFYVGLRPFGRITPNWFDLGSSLTFQYLHFGVRKWYYPFLIALFGCVIFIRKEKRLVPLYGLIIFLLFGFLSNNKTEIWHLFPLYPFLALLTSFFVFQMFYFGLRILNFSSNYQRKQISTFLTAIFLAGFAFFQIYKFKNEVRLFDQDISGLAYTAQAARNRSEKLYLYADYFLPSATFYSQKQVTLVAGEGYSLVDFIDNGPKPFLLLSEKWKMDLDKIPTQKYELLAQHKEYVLIKVR